MYNTFKAIKQILAAYLLRINILPLLRHPLLQKANEINFRDMVVREPTRPLKRFRQLKRFFYAFL